MSKNYYLILGVDYNASERAIKAAFRRKALELHPDISGLESGPFLELLEAYQVLINAGHRQSYDRQAGLVAAQRRPWGRAAEPLVPPKPRGEPLCKSNANQNFSLIPLAEILHQQWPSFEEPFNRRWRSFESLDLRRPKHSKTSRWRW